MKHNVWKNLELKIALILLIVVILLSLVNYLIQYNRYHTLTLEHLRLDAVKIHKYAEGVINPRSFYDLNTHEDQGTWLYSTTQRHMDEIRRVSNAKYLYTVKMNDAGEWIYLVDAWDMDDRNFVAMGTRVADGDPDGSLVAMLNRAMNDEVVFGDDVMNTEWGMLYITFFPFHDHMGDVIGVIGIDFAYDDLHTAIMRTRVLIVIISIVLAGAFIGIAFIFVRGVVHKAESVMTGMELVVEEALERATLMLDTSPLCAHILDDNLNIIDCNEAAVSLYGFKNKQEYIDRFFDDCIPERQPDGQLSSERRMTYINQAFVTGMSVYKFTYKMPDNDSPMPAEVTLVRSEYHNGIVVIAYTNDLRDITQMTSKIQHLEKENEKVFYDALTNIHNRRFFDETLNRVLRSLSRSGGSLSLLMIDIDYFKKYNDTYGHSDGDECLKAVAGVLMKSVRPDDFIARYGGEEFAAVLPNTDEIGARSVADRLLENIRERALPHAASDAADIVTISIGITAGTVARTHSADDYIKRANEMLYISKKDGRNRYTFGSL